MGIKEMVADCVLYKDMKKFGGPAKNCISQEGTLRSPCLHENDCGKIELD